MTATLTPPAPPGARRPLAQSSATPGRRLRNALASVFITGSFLVAMVPLVLVIGYVIARGSRVMSWNFLTSDIPIVTRSVGGGMGPAVVGTLMITGAATLLAVPVGVLGGIYLHEYGAGGRPARAVRFLADVMTGVPSIVMGLFIFAIWVTAAPVKVDLGLFQLHLFGVSGFAGSLALASLMLPVVIRVTEEMLRLVPADQRESAYALGGRKAGTIVRVVLPAAAPGIISGVLLAVARAAGETAPLLFTILTVNTTNTNLFEGPNTALSVQIFRNAQQVFQGPQDRAWGAALALIGIVFLFTILARVVAALVARKHHA